MIDYIIANLEHAPGCAVTTHGYMTENEPNSYTICTCPRAEAVAWLDAENQRLREGWNEGHAVGFRDGVTRERERCAGVCEERAFRERTSSATAASGSVGVSRSREAEACAAAIRGQGDG